MSTDTQFLVCQTNEELEDGEAEENFAQTGDGRSGLGVPEEAVAGPAARA